MIHELIPKIAAELGAIGKNRQMGDQGGYKYRGVEDIVNALSPILASHGVYVRVEVLERETTFHDRVDRQGVKYGFQTHSILKVAHWLIAADESIAGPWVTIGEALDVSDKSSNKAMTAAWKYAMVDAFTIAYSEMDDPDDHRLVTDGSDEPRQRGRQRQQQRAPRAQRPERPADESSPADEAPASGGVAPLLEWHMPIKATLDGIGDEEQRKRWKRKFGEAFSLGRRGIGALTEAQRPAAERWLEKHLPGGQPAPDPTGGRSEQSLRDQYDAEMGRPF